MPRTRDRDRDRDPTPNSKHPKHAKHPKHPKNTHLKATPPRLQTPQSPKTPGRRPPPLALAYSDRPLSAIPEQGDMAIVRDPYFWKRFSTAVHLDEEKTVGNRDSGRSLEKQEQHRDDWLSQQRKEKRRCKCIAWIAVVVVVMLVVGVVLGWYFTIGKSLVSLGV